MEKGIDRRRFKRYLFDEEGRLTGRFALFGGSGRSFSAKVLNLSEGGLGLKFGRDAVNTVFPGDRIQIETITGLPELDFLAGMELAVRWVAGYKPERGLRMGCEFVNPESKITEKIQEFVNRQIRQKLQSGDEAD